jgi:hypothetical protein
MPDLIQVAQDLKNAPDQWLAQQMQNPTGVAPPWLIASEVQRREQLRSGASKAQQPTSSVSQDLIRSLFARIPPTAGLGPPQGPGQAPPGMPPVNLTPGSNPSTLGAGPGGTPPGNFRMPPRQMAEGGEYDDEEDDAGPASPDLYNLPLREPSRREQLQQLMLPPQTPQVIQPTPPPAAPAPPAAAMPSGPVGSASRMMPDSGGAPNPIASSTADPIARLVNDAAQKYQLPPELITAVMKRESQGNPNAISPKGAIGLMQLMPDTAADMGIKDPKLLLDPAINIDTGARYLKKMMVMFNGDVRTALAAYNAGPGAVKKHGGVPPYQETQDYAGPGGVLKTVNALRAQSGLPPLDPTQVPGSLRSNYIQQQMTPPAAGNTGPGEFNDWRNNSPAAASPADATAPATNAATAAPGGAPATVPSPPAAAPVVIKKPEPLHQTWEQPAVSPEAAQIQEQIDARLKGHQSVEERQKALFGQENLDLLKEAGTAIFGKPQDYTKYSTAIQNVMDIAQRNMHPKIGDMLMQFGLALMSSPAHNFGMAVGQAGTYALQNMAHMKQQGMQDYLAATKAGVELQDKIDLYNARIGQYKMQRLGAQQSGVAADERAFQQEIAALQRQKNTAQINFEKTLSTPAAVNNMAVGIMNREGITFDPTHDPIKQLVATGRTDLINEAYMAGKPGAAGKGMNSVQQTQETRAISLLAMLKDDWDPATNPDDAQYPTARAKIEAKHRDLAGMITTAQGANFPEQMREANDYAAAVVAGREDPSMTGMYGKQALIKAILENKYHYDVAKAVLEWNATKAFYANANNSQFIEYSQNVANVANQIPYVVNAYQAWKTALQKQVPDYLTRFQGFNKAALNWSQNTGGELGAIARTLNAHIADLQASLPKVYSGGYAPHSEEMDRVNQMIGADWDEPSFNAGMDVITNTMLARKNAMQSVTPRFAGTTYTKSLPGSTEQPGGGKQQYRNLHKKGDVTIGVGADGKWHNVATGELYQ